METLEKDYISDFYRLIIGGRKDQSEITVTLNSHLHPINYLAIRPRSIIKLRQQMHQLNHCSEELKWI